MDGFRARCCVAAVLAVVVLGVTSCAPSQAPQAAPQTEEAARQPVLRELSATEQDVLDSQRIVIATLTQQRYSYQLQGTVADLPILQQVVDDHVYTAEQTYELQCLGVAFGDVLTSETPLHWAIISDEYGTDPTLQYEDTTLVINALTIISKRVESGQPVDLAALLETTRAEVERLGPTAD